MASVIADAGASVAGERTTASSSNSSHAQSNAEISKEHKVESQNEQWFSSFCSGFIGDLVAVVAITSALSGTQNRDGSMVRKLVLFLPAIKTEMMEYLTFILYACQSPRQSQLKAKNIGPTGQLTSYHRRRP